MSLSLAPLPARTRRSSHIADNLKNLITSGQLKPGDRLPTENTLCKQFGVSRTTLREAIQMLRTHGLLDVCPGRGSYITVPNKEDILPHLAFVCRSLDTPGAHVAELRLLLQRDALTRMATLPPAKRQELYHHVLSRTADAAENAEAEQRWHLTMVTLSSPALHGFFMECLLRMEAPQRLERFSQPDEVMRTIHTQLRINTAISDGDFALADRALSQYLTLTSGATNPGSKVTAFPLDPSLLGTAMVNG